MSLEDLMVRLLPVAAQYALVPISNYKVGAVAQGGDGLYLGANVEFAGQALNTSVHAEQSVVTNAWLHGESNLQTLAVTAPPCGHCRQFLNELNAKPALKLLLPKTGTDFFTNRTLLDYLPDAFGPQALGREGGLMEFQEDSARLILKEDSQDSLVLHALAAAKKSYAPYTRNYAGCAIQTTDGVVFSGRYSENAAHNPSLPPLQSALTFLNMNHPLGQSWQIARTVLVEKPARCRQYDTTRNTLTAVAPAVTLEYHEATRP